jgi:hypothetical protein
MKYGDEILDATIFYLKTVQYELGETLGSDRVIAMLDAFDPELKTEMLMRLFTDDHVGGVTGTLRFDTTFHHPSKITAIKWLRYGTGEGLRETKDWADEAERGGTVKIKHIKSYEVKREVISNLNGTGYSLT